jgi:hypothetical protein
LVEGLAELDLDPRFTALILDPAACVPGQVQDGDVLSQAVKVCRLIPASL